MNDAEIGDRCRIDVEERQPLGTPEWDEVQGIKAPYHADHVDVLSPRGRHPLVVGAKRCELAEGAILFPVVRAVEHVVGMVVVHLSVESTGRQ